MLNKHAKNSSIWKCLNFSNLNFGFDWMLSRIKFCNLTSGRSSRTERAYSRMPWLLYLCFVVLVEIPNADIKSFSKTKMQKLNLIDIFIYFLKVFCNHAPERTWHVCISFSGGAWARACCRASAPWAS